MDFRHRFDSLAVSLDRRRFLTRALGGGLAIASAPHLFAAKDFWNTKDPSTWSEEEISVLISRSPWTREAVPNVRNADDPTGLSGAGGRGQGRPRIALNLIVRWDSAQPVLDATRAKLPAEFEGHYVLSVSNLEFPRAPRPDHPGGEVPPDEALERTQAGTTLEVKGRSASTAGITQRSRTGALLFGFLKDAVRLAPGDREIIFRLDTGSITAKCSFDAREMLYHGKLAL